MSQIPEDDYMRPATPKGEVGSRGTQNFEVEMAETALKYAAASWLIFPCVPGAKNPLTKNGFKDATADIEQVRAWLRQWPAMNVATPTGEAAGASVLDEDNKKGKRGDLALAALEREFGPLPKTWTQRTPSGGKHYFFKPVPGLKSSTSKLADGLDVKSELGYVLLPPSVVEDKPYEWLIHPSEVPIAEMPQWLVDRLLKLQERTEAKKKTPLKDVKPGERNPRLFSLGRTLRRQGMDEVQIGAGMILANDGFEEPLGSDEVQGIIASVIRQPDEPGWPAPTAAEEKDIGGERFTDRENARLLEAFSAGEVRHADEMGEKWHQVEPLRWSLDFKVAVVPYVQRVVQYYFTCRDQELATFLEKKALVAQLAGQVTNEDEKGAAS